MEESREEATDDSLLKYSAMLLVTYTSNLMPRLREAGLDDDEIHGAVSETLHNEFSDMLPYFKEAMDMVMENQIRQL